MTETDALQTCLAAEHAALFGYGVLGGVLAGLTSQAEALALANASYLAHRTRRDALVQLVTDLDADPVAAAPVYDVRGPTDSAVCRANAQQLERRTAAVYAYAVALTTAGRRQFASTALGDCAVRAVQWGGRPSPLPGIEKSS